MEAILVRQHYHFDEEVAPISHLTRRLHNDTVHNDENTFRVLLLHFSQPTG